MKFKLLLIFSLFSFNLFFSQENKEIFNSEEEIKHQVGIGLNSFVKSAFTSDDNTFSLDYRYKVNQKLQLRAGLSYDEDTGENGYRQGGIKFGIDKNLRRYSHWNFYYGSDLMYKYSNFKNVNKAQHDIGIGFLLGIQYYISKHFSLSTEPTLYFKNIIVVDHNTFLKNNIDTWSEFGLGKIGYVQLNFHF